MLGYAHVFAIFLVYGAASDVKCRPSSPSFFGYLVPSVSGLVGRPSSSIIFLTQALEREQRHAAAFRPFTDSLKKERNSSTPCEVCAYLLATARLTVKDATPTSSATSLDHHGLQSVGAMIEKFTLGGR